MLAVLVIATALNAGYFLPIIFRAFFDKEDQPPKKDHGEAPWPMVAALATTAALVLVPLMAVIGSPVLWGILPFMLLALGAMWYALRRNERDLQILEVLTLTTDTLHLTRQTRTSDPLEWQCNPYWTKVNMHHKGGPVPHYVTLSGSGREVEIGAFLSEDERKELYAELSEKVRRIATP